MYTPSSSRYAMMQYRRCGKSGLKLPAISLGLWHNFGGVDDYDQYREILHVAFDQGITHFDLANNYGPPPGSAEENFGKILASDFKAYRDELIISTKAGYTMWEGPYGDWGSRKYLISSLDQSLKRMGLDYVDVFYHHRPDPETPLEETMTALNHIVKQGKALYVGISNYDVPEAEKAIRMLKQMGTPCLIHQPRYSMFDRWVENGLLDLLAKQGVGCIPFSPLAQGLLTDKYLHGVPVGSRASKAHGFLRPSHITPQKLEQIEHLNQIAINRGQTLAQMALAWILKSPVITSVLIGASKAEQVTDAVHCLHNLYFSEDEIFTINTILAI
ncbi:L-glyceraldehyde 3-phosphate reductase [Pedobacter sp. BS3]|uniref:L-glyceraldehyde 3-phosphate reductase n=1 Tax=Pedobacter sp. BS3 TaxID=2567937 RepID=UPI0011F091C5|nr:L-glyceraldehyde 3-phosphate reductase [Pedobacter sp. BS3]TZF84724.1 L-glyceraldehyde 3-phosphate reductase [Pedobacter sp. BS3]